MIDAGLKTLSLKSRMGGDMGEVMDFCSTIAPELNDLLDFVRKNSPYYCELWEDVPSDGSAQLHRYPVADPASYWAANTCVDSSVLTGPHFNGVTLRSGGTPTDPKMTSFTKDELKMMSQQLGTGILAAGIRAHDRIANLFHSGEMSGSFLLHVLSLTDLTVPMVHLPIGGSSSPETTLQYMRACSATVVFSSVATLINLAEYLIEHDETMPKLRALMFCGEPFYDDQRELVLEAFPCARIRSLLYGTMDAGVLGYSTSMYDSRQHTVSTPYVVLEIAPDGKVPTIENGVPGRVLVTNLGRRLQPIIRFPTGDRAEWIDYAGGKFRVLGKDAPGILLGSSTVDVTQIRQIVLEVLGVKELSAFQMRITREDMKDVLILRIGAKPADQALTKKKILKGVNEVEPRLQDLVSQGEVAPLQIEFIDIEEFRMKPSRKTVDVVDDRYVI